MTNNSAEQSIHTTLEELSSLNRQINNFINYDTTDKNDTMALRDMVDISPNFQRGSVWKAKYKCELISSIILKWPIPAVILNEEIDGHFEVFDGKQRLTTISDFLNNRIKIKDEMLPSEYQGKLFKELAQLEKNEILKLRIPVIRMKINADYKGKLFTRINDNTIRLSPGEIRKGLYCNNIIFQKLSEYAKNTLSDYVKGIERLNHEDAMCRIFALNLKRDQDFSKMKKNIMEFLNDKENELKVDAFLDKNNNILQLFDFQGFQRAKLWIALGQLHVVSSENLKKYREELRELVDKFKTIKAPDVLPGLMPNHSNYQNKISDFIRHEIDAILSVKKDPRLFDKKLKKALFLREGNPTCYICNCALNTGNIQADHVVPYTKGGKTEEANLGWACNICNGEKTDKTLQDLA